MRILIETLLDLLASFLVLAANLVLAIPWMLATIVLPETSDWPDKLPRAFVYYERWV